MPKEITQRQLRNESGEVMRGLDRGDTFVVTRNGVAVGELRPIPRRRLVGREVALAAFFGAAPIDASRLRRDIDAVIDQDSTPRA
jgi:antitoxin (DNA-binding transcriptional repressor) of toxin-antitoxin stability system